MKPDKYLLRQYKIAVAERFHLANPSQWKQRDLEYLIDKINEKSGVRLSLSTMKRLVKDDFALLPHVSTLNALVSILNFDDWQAYRLSQDRKKSAPSRSFMLVSASTIIVIVTLILIVPGFEQTEEVKPTVNGEVRFSADKIVSRGVPNTVVFNYDLKHVEADTFSIQQSWNQADRRSIDPDENYYSRIYYYPGYHKAKLIANDSVLRVQPIHITTNGWEPIVRFDFYKSLPIYVSGVFVSDGIFGVSNEDLDKNEIESSREMTMTYNNIRDFDNVSSDNFYMSIKIKNDSSINQPCPELRFTIHAEKHIFYVPFTLRGCEANVEAKFGETRLNGSNSDMAPFGGEVYVWQNFELTVVDKKVALHKNGELIIESSFEEDFGRIMGLACSFNGLGSLDYVRLGHAKEDLVYVEEFEMKLGQN